MLGKLIRITSAVADVGSTRGCVTIVQHERSHPSEHLRGSGNEAGLWAPTLTKRANLAAVTAAAASALAPIE